MIVFFTFFIILTVTIIGLFLYMGSGNISVKGVDFIAKGKEAGLSTKEIKMLKKVSDLLHLDRPLILLGSINNIDDAILRINDILVHKEYRDLDIIDLLEELHAYRKNIELDRRERRSQITGSKEITVNQQVKITIGNIEKPIIATVIENNPNYLSLQIKSDTNVKPGINWTGPINIFFWKKDDAGYYFESTVVETPQSKTWNINHSINLIRSQKRSDLRVDTDINCYVYKLESITKRNSKSQGFSGNYAQIKNISEGGVAFLINGKVQEETPLKIEFKIDASIVVLCGVVKKSSYNASNNISLVRMKIIDPAFEMLSILRPFLFIKSREINQIKDYKNLNSVENVEEINNNDIKDEVEAAATFDSESEEVEEVEYLSESSIQH